MKYADNFSFRNFQKYRLTANGDYDLLANKEVFEFCADLLIQTQLYFLANKLWKNHSMESLRLKSLTIIEIINEIMNATAQLNGIQIRVRFDDGTDIRSLNECDMIFDSLIETLYHCEQSTANYKEIIFELKRLWQFIYVFGNGQKFDYEISDTLIKKYGGKANGEKA